VYTRIFESFGRFLWLTCFRNALLVSYPLSYKLLFSKMFSHQASCAFLAYPNPALRSLIHLAVLTIGLLVSVSQSGSAGDSWGPQVVRKGSRVE
jgi:hypothetical protein